MTVLRGRPFSPIEAQVDMMKSHVTRGATRGSKTDGGRTLQMAVPQGWTREAKCIGDFATFDESVGLKAGEAAARCAGCPVVEACLSAAMAEEHGLSAASRYGIRGGLSPKERAAVAGEVLRRLPPPPELPKNPQRNERVRASRAARRACCLLCRAEIVAENLPRHWAREHGAKGAAA